MALNVMLKMAIIQSGLTQFDVADQADIHESRLSKIIRGRLPATAHEKKAISRVLRRPVHALFPPSEAVSSEATP